MSRTESFGGDRDNTVNDEMEENSVPIYEPDGDLMECNRVVELEGYVCCE
jgi:hypothetical protein